MGCVNNSFTFSASGISRSAFEGLQVALQKAWQHHLDVCCALAMQLLLELTGTGTAWKQNSKQFGVSTLSRLALDLLPDRMFERGSLLDLLQKPCQAIEEHSFGTCWVLLAHTSDAVFRELTDHLWGLYEWKFPGTDHADTTIECA